MQSVVVEGKGPEWNGEALLSVQPNVMCEDVLRQTRDATVCSLAPLLVSFLRLSKFSERARVLVVKLTVLLSDGDDVGNAGR